MKRLVCILLMAWLPILMVTASAMSMQMTLQGVADSAEQVHTMSCHDEIDGKIDNAEQCMHCGFCAITTSLASFGNAPTVNLPMVSSAVPAFIDVIFNSNHQDPTFRPPILI